MEDGNNGGVALGFIPNESDAFLIPGEIMRRCSYSLLVQWVIMKCNLHKGIEADSKLLYLAESSSTLTTIPASISLSISNTTSTMVFHRELLMCGNLCVVIYVDIRPVFI